MSRLTKIQEHALQELSEVEWKTAYNLGSGVPMNTLYALERKGLIERQVVGSVPWRGWERTSLEWRKKAEK